MLGKMSFLEERRISLFKYLEGIVSSLQSIFEHPPQNSFIFSFSKEYNNAPNSLSPRKLRREQRILCQLGNFRENMQRVTSKRTNIYAYLLTKSSAC